VGDAERLAREPFENMRWIWASSATSQSKISDDENSAANSVIRSLKRSPW